MADRLFEGEEAVLRVVGWAIGALESDSPSVGLEGMGLRLWNRTLRRLVVLLGLLPFPDVALERKRHSATGADLADRTPRHFCSALSGPDLTYERTRGSGGMRPVMVTPAPG
jgi:hypothetical protein